MLDTSNESSLILGIGREGNRNILMRAPCGNTYGMKRRMADDFEVVRHSFIREN